MSRILATCLLAFALVGCDDSAPPGQGGEAIVLGVNDVFATPTFSGCVGQARPRDYAGLAAALSERAGVSVELRYFATEPQLIAAAEAGEIDGTICKTWTAVQAARAAGADLHRLGDLSMPGGPERLEGVFFVRADSPATQPEDLTGKRIAIGSDASYEKAQAARARLEQWGVRPAELVVIPTCLASTAAVWEGRVDAACQSSYAFEFGTLEQVAERSDFREIDRTEAMPFVTVAVFGRVSATVRGRLAEALAAIAPTPPADLGKTRIIVPADKWTP